ncbi:MAG TPA: hypothetical protein VHC20_05345, partial [Candidatus Paceibacterota bacterium]|nr:hypothetical protein [Candidatus Paceibacterota bacterium]
GLGGAPGTAGNALAHGIVGSALTQGLAMATGLQQSFNWASMVQAVLSSGSAPRQIGSSISSSPEQKGGAGFSWGEVDIEVRAPTTTAEDSRLMEGVAQSDFIQNHRLAQIDAYKAASMGIYDLPADYAMQGLGSLQDEARGDAVLKQMRDHDFAIALVQQRISTTGTPSRAVTIEAVSSGNAPRSFAASPVTAAADSFDTLWNQIGRIDEQLVPGMGWLSPAQGASSAQYWRDKADSTGNGLYVLPQAAAQLWADYADQIAIALSARGAKTPAEGGGFDLSLKYKPSWNAAQRAEADVKVQFLSESETVVTSSNRSGTASAVDRYRATEQVPSARDVDHKVDLQLGGTTGTSNLNSLDASVNRSLGAQIHQLIKDLPIGTIIKRVIIGD